MSKDLTSQLNYTANYPGEQKPRMKSTYLLLSLSIVSLFMAGCSDDSDQLVFKIPTPTPIPNIEATVEARVEERLAQLPTPTPQIIEIVVEKVVEKPVILEKEVVVEKEIIVEVPVEKVVEKPVIVEKEVVKEARKTEEVEKEVVKEVVKDAIKQVTRTVRDPITNATSTRRTPMPFPKDECDPAYPDVCIPPKPPDLECVDIFSRSNYRNFVVLPPDPHGLDGNGNGIGCES